MSGVAQRSRSDRGVIAERHPQGALDLPARERIIGQRGRGQEGPRGGLHEHAGTADPVGRSPDGIAITPDGKTVYVANMARTR
jgi:hypothetical protein